MPWEVFAVQPRIKKGATLELTCESLAYGGLGVCRDQESGITVPPQHRQATGEHGRRKAGEQACAAAIGSKF